MSWPHLLSFSRILVSPLVAALALAPAGDVYLVAALLFALASLTDAFDGKLARRTQRVSPLGIFLDTTADKVLVSLSLVALAVADLAPVWVVLVIIGREFLISGLRSFAASYDEIISAHAWGKGKAAVTMIAITLVLLSAAGNTGGLLGRVASHTQWHFLYLLSQGVLILAAVLTIVSGARYFVDALPLFRRRIAIHEVPREEQRRVAAGGDGR